MEVKKFSACESFAWRIEHEDGVIHNLRERTHGAHESGWRDNLLSARDTDRSIVCIRPPDLLLMLLYNIRNVQANGGPW